MSGGQKGMTSSSWHGLFGQVYESLKKTLVNLVSINSYTIIFTYYYYYYFIYYYFL